MRLRRLLPLLPLLALASLCAPAAARSEETVLFYERQSRKLARRPTGGSVAGDSSRTSILITLGDRRLVVYEPEETWIYDFDARRVQCLEPRTGSYSDWSLYGFVAFAEMELDHRLGLRSRIMAAQSGPGPSVLDLESLFSMRSLSTPPGKRESLADSSRGGEFRYFVNRTLAVAATLTDTVLPPLRRDMLERFFIYRCHLHPEARRSLVRSGRVPRTLFFRYHDFTEETQVVMNLIRVSSAPEANTPLASARRVDVPDESWRPLSELLAACRTCEPSRRSAWVEDVVGFESRALASRRYLDAALAREERALACEVPAAWSTEITGRAGQDSTFRSYRAASWKDSASAVAAVRRLDRIAADSLEKRYVLEISKARARIAAGDLTGGTQLLLRALSGNPCLAVPWQELGEAYFSAYQPVLAWTCFDMARTVAKPGCEAITRTDRRERVLRGRHPEYF